MYGWHVSTVGDLVGHDLTRLVEPWYVYSDISMITTLIINNDISTKKSHVETTMSPVQIEFQNEFLRRVLALFRPRLYPLSKIKQ